MVSISVRCIPGKNILVDQLSCPDKILPIEWSLPPQVFENICRKLSSPVVDLFATRMNSKLPIYVFRSRLHGMEGNIFQHSWVYLSVHTFPLFTLLRQVLLRLMLSWKISMILVAPLWPQRVWFPDLLSLLVKETFELPMLRNLLVQPYVRKF